jgi:hypothetical protein
LVHRLVHVHQILHHVRSGYPGDLGFQDLGAGRLSEDSSSRRAGMIWAPETWFGGQDTNP